MATRKRRLGRKGALAALMTSLMLLLSAVPAQAHGVYEVATYFNDGSRCADARSELNHPSGAPNKQYVRADSRTMTVTFMICGASNWYLSAGYLRAKNVLQKQSGSSWSVCWTGPTGYNVGSQYRVQVETTFLPSSPICGTGTYRNVSTASFYNGMWIDSLPLSSGHHSFTAL